jgi:hypothetical protein
MSYVITLENGNILTTVPDTQLVSTFAGLDLIGLDYSGFGTILNNNLVHMIEHFANSTPPSNPFVGQIWYDTVSGAINYWNGTQFKAISVITSSPTAPLNPNQGDEWYNTITQQVFIWNGFEWILVGPPNAGGSQEGFVVQTIPTNNGNIYYLDLYANNELLGVVSALNLINPDIVGFGNIRPGWNFVTNPETAPLIIESGIYNVSEITLGNADQLAFDVDNNNNGIVAVTGGNVMIATNSTDAANAAAFAEFTNGNISGTVYFHNIVAASYGNIPTMLIPGSNGQIIYNDAGVLAGSNAVTILSGNVTASLNTLNVSGLTTIDGNLHVNGANTVVQTIFATTYENLPPFSVPGSSGEFLYNNGGGVGASTQLVLSGTAIDVTTSLNVTSNIVVGGNAVVDGNLAVDGVTTLNNGTSGQFTMPTTQGTVAGSALLTTAAGATLWGSVNLASWINSLTSNGYQFLPGGLILQWGTTGSLSNDTPTPVNFQIHFPNACLAVVVTDTFAGSKSAVWSAYNYGTTNFTARCDENTATGTFFAVGF